MITPDPPRSVRTTKPTRKKAGWTSKERASPPAPPASIRSERLRSSRLTFPVPSVSAFSVMAPDSRTRGSTAIRDHPEPPLSRSAGSGGVEPGLARLLVELFGDLAGQPELLHEHPRSVVFDHARVLLVGLHVSLRVDEVARIGSDPRVL